MKATKGTARLAGALYLLVIVGGTWSLKIVPDALVVSGDAAITAHNIAAHESTWRLAIYAGALCEFLFLCVGLTLYALLKEAGRDLARAMVILVGIQTVIGVVDLSLRAAPLVLLGGAGYLSAIPPTQLDALALGALKLSDIGNQLATLFWGLWLWPLGVLVIRSGYLPKVIGWLLLLNGVGWIGTGVAGFLAPVHPHGVDSVLRLFLFGEPVLVLWLLVMGAKVPAQEAVAA